MPSASASNLCILPLLNGQPLLEVESRQPYRMAKTPKLIPGFDGLLVNAMNRHEIYEIKGHSYNKVEAEFPNVWRFAYSENIHQLANGDAIGISYKPRKIYYAKSGKDGFHPIPKTENYHAVSYDETLETLFVKTHYGGRTFIYKDDGLTPFDMPDIQENGQNYGFGSLRYLPELDGYLSSAGERLWFLREGDTEWRLIQGINIYRESRIFDYSLQKVQIQIDIANSLMTLNIPGGRGLLIIEVENNRPILASKGFRGSWHYHAASKSWIAWAGGSLNTRKKRFWEIFTKPTKPPSLNALLHGERSLAEFSKISPRKHESERTKSFDTLIHSIPTLGILLIHLPDGLASYDGKEVVQLQGLEYDTIGYHPRVMREGGLTFIQSEKGLFRLMPNMTAKKIQNFPFAEPWPHSVTIKFIEKLGLFLIVGKRTGKLYVSNEMQSFTKVESSAIITEIVSSLPDRSAALLVGNDGLYTIENNCDRERILGD